MEAQQVKVGAPLASPSAESPNGRAAYWTRGRNTHGNKKKGPINATFYTVATLQSLTNSFSLECLVGEGSYGRVYWAKLSNSKVSIAMISSHFNL